ncbi:MAG: DNA translocase FtsK [Minisyncoccales bacterium]
MAKKKKKKVIKKEPKRSKLALLALPLKVKKIISGATLLLLSVIIVFSFFGQSGIAGEYLRRSLAFVIGSSIFIFPAILFASGLVIFKTRYKKFILPTIISSLLIILGLSGIFDVVIKAETFGLIDSDLNGGFVGKVFGGPLFSLFDFWITLFILLSFTVVGLITFAYLLITPAELKEERPKESVPAKIFRKIFGRKSEFTVKEIDQVELESVEIEKEDLLAEKEKPQQKEKEKGKEKEKTDRFPPLDLLESDKGIPSSGDIKVNSAIIKKTLENFDIPVEMSEVRVGPTVAQYTLKPAEGVKLSRITSLSNDLSLALAAHSIRIEAPIPGRSLVGIEIPNRIRAEVRLRSLMEDPQYNDPDFKLPIVIGKDVTGALNYARLEKMPHLLVAGSTGSGKTIFLNTLILSLLFRNTPETLRLILVDPKRVEFSNFEGIPHLLCPVIYDVNRTYNALKWLVGEMKRRLQVMSEVKARDINSYNKIVLKKKNEDMESMPYIVLVVDELADLMIAKGKEIEAEIVRLAQMARASGIHLVLTTQRPSVEVITGLIKANIISRVAFQVASQVDSRTILDTAGAEKLLGAGDMLYMTGDMFKPKRAQAPYVSESEIQDVVKWIVSEYGEREEDKLSDQLEGQLETTSEESFSYTEEEDDPLYEEAKNLVIETKKASASFLQRRLRVGYARAARLIDMMEDRGVVGPGDGAKPREIYAIPQEAEDGETWQKL